MTGAEIILWREIRKRKLGASFRRQYPLYGFVVDFFSPECDLAIEVDGPVHEHRSDWDARRDERLGAASIEVLRFTNDDVADDLPRVLREIEHHASLRLRRR